MAYSSALDPTFGAGGILSPAASGLADASAVAVQQADSKVVAVSRGVVHRFNIDGSVDTTFGTGGVANVPMLASSVVTGGTLKGVGISRNLAIGVDGSISFAGPARFTNSDGTATSAGVVIRLTSTGQLDPSFGTGGLIRIDGSYDNYREDVAFQGDGKLLVEDVDPDGNLYVNRYTTAGVLDTTFAGTGRLVIGSQFAVGSSTPRFTAIGLAYDKTSGRIYAAGTANVGSSIFAALVNINPDGTLDSSFGTNGAREIASNEGFVTDLTIEPNGDLLLVGHFNSTGTGTGSLMRILPDGTTDATFGANTRISSGLNQFVEPSAAVVGTDGRITVGGMRRSSGDLIVLARYNVDGTPDVSFGNRGQYTLPLGNQTVTGQNNSALFNGMALTPGGNIVVVGGLNAHIFQTLSFPNVLAEVMPVAVTAPQDDYNGDGTSDIAAYLTDSAVYAIRPSGSTTDLLNSFGHTGAGASIPAPGDYDGSGYTEMAVYVPSLGAFYYRSAASLNDIKVTFGTAGAGASIPAVGDYDGDGITDLAVYEPATGSFLVRDSTTGATRTVQFGAAGTGASIPAPGDYDGDGKDDLAVYIPSLGVLAYRPSSGGPDVLTSFGMPGDRMSIPAPGDYDADGRTDLAVYLPSVGVYAYRPSSGGADVLRSFGITGDGASIPAPGDYDGDGRTDLAVYVPQYALYAYRPSGAVATSSDIWTTFGTVGDGATVPTASIPYAQPATVSGLALAASSEPGLPVAFSEADVAELAGATMLAAKKSRHA